MNRIARMWRTLIPRRGSVARPSDRVQGGLLALVVLLALVALPVAASFGSETFGHQRAQSAQELAERSAVTATLLADGPELSVSPRSGLVGNGAPTDATWVLPDGTRRFGRVVADEGTLKGHTFGIWVDRDGNPVDPPLSGAAVVIDAAGVGLGLWLAALIVLAVAYRLSVFSLDRLRFARWQQEWFADLDRKTRS
ncbi:Rv1733c family protein [Amycolatopsis sp. NPDC004747]